MQLVWTNAVLSNSCRGYLDADEVLGENQKNLELCCASGTDASLRVVGAREEGEWDCPGSGPAAGHFPRLRFHHPHLFHSYFGLLTPAQLGPRSPSCHLGATWGLFAL